MYIQYIYKYKRTTPIGSRSSLRATTGRTPHALHPTPYTLHPTPHALHPTPCTLRPTPYREREGGAA